MIRFVEALNYRCLRYIAQPLEPFQILVGPNASGKTTFLDAIMFLGDLLSCGLEEALGKRAKNIQELFYCGQGDRFELAVELVIARHCREALPDELQYRFVRYEVAIGVDDRSGEYQILDEQALLMSESGAEKAGKGQPLLFPYPMEPPGTIMHRGRVGRGCRRSLRKKHGGNDNYYSEIQNQKGKGGWAPSFRLGPRKSALANLPEIERGFPVSTWLRDILRNNMQKLMLNAAALRQTSPPGQGRLFLPDGSNLPWVIENLRRNNRPLFRQWIEHLQTALPDVEDIVTTELPDTRHRFLQVCYRGGLRVPSWTLSDGTLRMLALTLPAYLPEFQGIYLIEEPENGIHPMAVETVYQALSSVYEAQILMATHSPILLGCARPKDLLCFKKDADGATAIVCGAEHPALADWQGTVTLSDLYASGVLG